MLTQTDTSILEEIFALDDYEQCCERDWPNEGECDNPASLLIRWSPCECGPSQEYYCLPCYNVHIKLSYEGCDGTCGECGDDVVMVSVTTIK